jgi:ribosomal protein S13
MKNIRRRNEYNYKLKIKALEEDNIKKIHDFLKRIEHEYERNVIENVDIKKETIQ